MKGKHEGVINDSSIANRNLSRMKIFREHAERKHSQAKVVLNAIEETEKNKLLQEARENEDKVYRTLK